MTHDPLCPKWFETYDDQLECPTCDLIAKVRADERNRVFTHLDALADRDHTEGCPSLTCTGCADQTCEEALAALDRGDPIHVSGEEMRRFIAVIDARR